MFNSRCLVFPLLYVACVACSGSGDAAFGTGSGTDAGSTVEEVPTTGHVGDSLATSTMPAMTSSSGADGESATSGAGEESATSGSGSGATTGGGSGCGDGVVDPGEACDDGAGGNGDTRYCKEDCTLNVCGDGKLLVGWELCDSGPGNSDDYGHTCSAQCTPGNFCGDHIVQAPFETCDLGAGNGTMKGDEQGILCDPNCRAQQLRGFVTEAAFSGDLGGVFGADLKCRAAAMRAGLPAPERFHALLSSGDEDAKSRFKAVVVSLPYVLVTGKKFADNFATLLADGPLGEGITASETGGALYQKRVATDTAPGGARFSPDQHCQDWTSADPAHKVRVGLNAVPMDSPDLAAWESGQWWISALTFACDKQDFHLYCLEI